MNITYQHLKHSKVIKWQTKQCIFNH